MMKVGSKRRRTKNEIEEEKQEEIVKQQKLQADLEELANLRGRIQQAEQVANTNVEAAQLMSQMIVAGHIQEDAQGGILLNGVNGIEGFVPNNGRQEVQIEVEGGLEQLLQEEAEDA